MEKGHTELSLRSMTKDASRAHLQSDKSTQRLSNNQRDVDTETSSPSSCNQGGCVNDMFLLPRSFLYLMAADCLWSQC